MREPRGIIALVLIFLALGSLYSVVTPIFEAGDEVWHYPFVQHLATGHSLPIQDPARKALWEQEGGQPPLYYALAAALTFWIDTGDMETRLWRNPYARIGIPLAYGNKNLVVHTAAENLPWRNTTLAVHLIRLFSLLLSAATVAFTYLLAREITPAPTGTGEGWGLLAAAFVAFNPMFLFISASVNNDSLAAALAACALWLNVRLVTRGATTRRLLALGIVVGLSALTKVSDLALIPLTLLVVAWLAWRGRAGRLPLRAAALVVIPALSLAGWWYARNYYLYGDPLALDVWLQIAGGRAPTTLLGLLDEFQGLRISFWGNFGGVNLIAPEWVYGILDLISLLALGGLVIAALRRTLPPMLWIPAAWLAVISISLIRWTLLTYASQGRLIFPAISAVAVLLTFGLTHLRFTFYVSRSRLRLRECKRFTPHASRLTLSLTSLLFLLTFALVAPFFIIAPAYALPTRLSADAAAPNPVHITYNAGEAQPELVGFEIGRSVRAGAELPLTLYWRTRAAVGDDLYVYIHLYDARGERIGQWDAYPGNGLYPIQFWQPGEIVVDRYRVPVAPTAAGQQLGRVEVGLARVGTTVPLAARDPNGVEIVPSLARFKLARANPDTAGVPVRFGFGDALGLTDVAVRGERGITEFQVTTPRVGALETPLRGGDRVRVAFALVARRALAEDFTLFVHLTDAQGKIVAQHDAPPRGGAYPTSFWEADEAVADEMDFTIPADAPPGEYRLEFGIYRAGAGTRLAATGAPWEGWRAMGDYLALAPIVVEK